MARLVFCFDGTSNDPADVGDAAGDGSVSNVLKVFAFLGGSLRGQGVAHEGAAGQRCFYYSGVGTRGGWFERKFNALFAPPYGDMERIVDEAAGDLRGAFREGDEVFVVGFSRGAAIARIFAARMGELCPAVTKVRFVGVFDTVAAVRGSRDLDEESFPASGVLFENGSLGEHVEEAVHLVAIDERRLLFQPTLFNKDARVEEVWFAGAHSDVGGGFYQDGLSDVALEFMLGRCERAGLVRVSLDEVDYEGFFIPEEGMSEEVRLGREDLEIVCAVDGVLHAQERPGDFGLGTRTLRVMVDDEVSTAEGDVAVVHYTVMERMARVAGYRPAALRGVWFRVLGRDGEVGEIQRWDGGVSPEV